VTHNDSADLGTPFSLTHPFVVLRKVQDRAHKRVVRRPSANGSEAEMRQRGFIDRSAAVGRSTRSHALNFRVSATAFHYLIDMVYGCRFVAKVCNIELRARIYGVAQYVG
jgi:hypothetical protein